MQGESAYDPSSQERIVTKQGETFVVRLESTPTSGYVWEMQALPSGLASEGSAIEQPRSLQQPGDSAVQVFRFRAMSSGEYELHFVLKRKWEQEPAAKKSLTITVQ